MQAFDTDRSTCLGARHVVAFDSKRVVAFDSKRVASADTDATASNNYSDSIGVTIEFYHTHAEAMQSLEQILETMENGMEIDADASHKGLQALVQSMRVTVQERVLHHLLEQDRLARLCVDLLPLELSNWLTVSCQCRPGSRRGLGAAARPLGHCLIRKGSRPTETPV
jgi:hypothetical protein